MGYSGTRGALWGVGAEGGPGTLGQRQLLTAPGAETEGGSQLLGRDPTLLLAALSPQLGFSLGWEGEGGHPSVTLAPGRPLWVSQAGPCVVFLCVRGKAGLGAVGW